MKNRNILLFLLIFISVGCSSMKVTKSIIGDEVSQTENWDITFTRTDIDSTEIFAITPEFKDTLNNNFYRQSVIDSVHYKLTSHYNFPIFCNRPSTGTIIVDIETSSYLKFPDTKYLVTYLDRRVNTKDETFIELEPVIMTDYNAPINRIIRDDKITGVRIIFLNEDSKIIGEINAIGHNIKTADISKLIYNAAVDK